MKIGILQSGSLPEELADKHGQYPKLYADMLKDRGFTFETFVVIENAFPDSVYACDGWLITGSAHGAYDDQPWIPVLEEFIRDAYAKNVPVAGICFGHQIMAQALGGKVDKFSGGWGVGYMQYQLADGRQVGLNAMHQDQVVERPAESEVIATSDFCAYAGLAYGDKAISFQPLPEFSTPFQADLLRARAGKTVSKKQAEKALAELRPETDAALVADIIAEFFRKSQARKAA